MGRIWNLIWRGRGDTYRTIVVAILVAVGIRTFFFEPFNIPSGSMKPTLLVGDYLFVSKTSYGYSRHAFPWSFPPYDGRIFGSNPERGDVAVFKSPVDNSTDYIKRVIGLPGDRIQLQEGELYINGQLVPRRELGPGEPSFCGGNPNFATATLYEETLPGGVSHEIVKCRSSGPANNTRVFTVPPDHFFMMGDNRDNSNDSRGTLGSVPLDNFVGRADIIFMSFDDQSSLFSPGTWGELIRWGRLGQIID
ncbi:MAG: signal peptidase I [Pseudomonadota bacterium]